MSERKLKILYLEDIEDILQPWLAFIKRTWAEECHGVRSRERALELLENGFRPDLVIFDRGILYYEDDQFDDKEAGDRLYYELADHGIPVIVISGDDLEGVEPYRSQPPLKFVSKPIDERALQYAMESYFRWLEEGR